jgi:OOP family OmpA-OmpF porin
LAERASARHNGRVRIARVTLGLLLAGGVACSGSDPRPPSAKPLSATPDRDGDRLADDVDHCVLDPEDEDGFEDGDGCPDVDNDHDLVADVADRCLNDAEDKDGFEDEDGCPDVDDDKDQIPDAKDQCPREPETYNGKDDDDGCPDQAKVIVIACGPQPIIQRIHFKGATAIIAPEAMPIISASTDVMNAHPEILLVEIEGHTDENGNEAANVKLAQARAEAVVDAMVKLGVDRSRLRAQGFGGYCPVDAAHTEAAWEKNRRAEFKLLKTITGPTGVLTGCDAATAKGLVSKPLP